MTATSSEPRGKRLFDIVVASFALVIAAVPMLLLVVAVGLMLGRPVIFRQQRLGRDGVPFTILKFRSMRDAAPELGMVTDAHRITPFGAMLRASSLDELPSLVNVIRGDMSLVGPRPLLVDYADRFTLVEARRLEVRPGLTGLAQVSGRNSLPWEERFRLDVQYVDTVSPRLDLQVLVRTVHVVLVARGVRASGHATMHEFRPVSSDPAVMETTP